MNPKNDEMRKRHLLRWNLSTKIDSSISTILLWFLNHFKFNFYAVIQRNYRWFGTWAVTVFIMYLVFVAFCLSFYFFFSILYSFFNDFIFSKMVSLHNQSILSLLTIKVGLHRKLTCTQCNRPDTKWLV